MKYFGKPAGMWAVFGGSFRRELVRCFGLSGQSARETARKAKKKYRELIGRLPEFEKADRFMTNEVNCAMLAAFILSMPERPDVQRLTDYYARAMMTGLVTPGLPREREEPVHGEGHRGHASHGRPARRRPQPLFVEHGLLRVSGRQRL